MTTVCRVIGILDNGHQSLTAHVLTHIAEADVVIAGTRLLDVMKSTLSADAKCFDLTGNLPQVPRWITAAQSKNKKVVVLATGDPLCHGIANYLIKKLGADNIEVLPNLSMFQLACAKLGVAWQGCRIGSVHAKDAGEWWLGADTKHGLYQVLQLLRQSELTAIYTGPENTPDRLARMLQQEGLADQYDIAIAADLLQDEENISAWIAVDKVAYQVFSSLNIMLVKRKTIKNEATFGLPDHRFKQRKPDKGLITKREVRAVSLARMSLQPNSIVWDIGAGSGSVGLEASRLCPQGHVYAIEKNTGDAQIARDNKASLHATNYTLVHNKAPEGLDLWPNPDAIFIGGSGGELRQLILLCLKRLNHQGQLVMNFVTLENMNLAMTTLKETLVEWDVVQLQASRSKPILSMQRMQAENPVWIICAKKNY
ncbi:MAG: precorrin-6y C5,15-methyltransferase (decarboxylating) subunit CbiE [Methylococcales bacterium]|nr:precorrin-6y C5,15-methyltransferase (decarboxylating) subunit CbiE [Methylococcales bacterium]